MKEIEKEVERERGGRREKVREIEKKGERERGYTNFDREKKRKQK